MLARQVAQRARGCTPTTAPTVARIITATWVAAPARTCAPSADLPARRSARSPSFTKPFPPPRTGTPSSRRSTSPPTAHRCAARTPQPRPPSRGLIEREVVMICTICDSGEHRAPDCNLAELDSRKFHNVRTTATFDPIARQDARRALSRYRAGGRLRASVEFVTAHLGSTRGRHAAPEIGPGVVVKEVIALRAELRDLLGPPQA